MLEELPILSLITFSPLLGLLVLLFLPKQRSRWLKITAIAATFIPLALSLWLYADYSSRSPEDAAAYGESVTWVDVALNKETVGDVASYSFKLAYQMDIDGVSLPLMLLTTIVAAMAALASVHIKKRWKAFYFWFLLLEVGMLGVFMARDLFLFFIFFELTLVPMFFLIGIWGFFGREKAASRFLIYNGLGSAIMLVAFLLLTVTAGFHQVETGSGEGVRLEYSGSYEVLQESFSNPDSYINQGAPESGGDTAMTTAQNPFYLSEAMRWTIFLLLLIAFGIKLPIAPFHTWMLRVHAEAPPSIVMIHSGVLLKMGAYGLMRFGLFLFPAQAGEAAVAIAVLGAVNVLYGAILAMVQKDLKLVLAYSSISHMGIVLLGLASLNEIGLEGAVVQMVSHGLISALLFLIVGSLQERTDTTELAQLGGLARSMPFMSGVLLAAGMASLGLPGLSGFIGEFLSLLGLFDTQPVIVAVAVLGVVLAAVYVLRAVLAITYGPMPEKFAALRDARLVEAVPMIVLLAMIVLVGIYPSILTDPMAHGFDALIHMLPGGEAS
ncbi:complex I subunit 4 family protein [Paenibacillus methanolicus]|uniref:NADH-quinone oxidoreductase subunit M n=1 Tax=Paenibacillus methanolicus TaxID=582686 RepID=A0A5S5CB07_9BACL|nr:NADH-quinone oxidoreductase subunit M [Paenibacillus methanolicus]TYP75682.1 NADH-quinone oxidoreductase subunit M [Paenibacillus methanolicus]